jgi:hypothetical protein
MTMKLGVAVGIYMVIVTSCIAKIPTVPLATLITPRIFGWRNSWVLDELQDKLKTAIYGHRKVRDKDEVTDAEWSGWTAAY